MEKKKSVALTILGIIILTANFMYRKYRRMQLREMKYEKQRIEAKKYFEFQRKEDSIARQKEQDSISAARALKLKKEMEERREKLKEIRENLERLELEAKKQETEKKGK